MPSSPSAYALAVDNRITRATRTARTIELLLILVDVLLVLFERLREHVLALVLRDEVEVVGAIGRDRRLDRAAARARDRSRRQPLVLVRVVRVVLVIELRAMQLSLIH